MRFRLLLCAALACFGFGCTSAVAQDKFELKDGDRVVFLGNTLIEREQNYGHWELTLTVAWPERNVTFRNLGWSGDTVWGESRAGFGSQRDGFKKLVEEVSAAKPTVIFVGYGNVEAFAGEAGLPKFTEGFNQLLDVLEATKARIVVLAPFSQAVDLSPNPHAAEYNVDVARYSAAMKEISGKRGHRFLSLDKRDAINAKSPGTAPQTTINGSELSERGYAATGMWLADELELWPDKKHEHLATPTALLRAIQKKNELFFHRWRPQNETYLFGFRKHEQGKNAAEVFQFDPLVEAEEKKIAEERVKAQWISDAELKRGVK